MPATTEDVLAFLADLGIEAATVSHEPVFTVEESQRLRGQIPGAHTKNLFLRNNKRSYFLVTLGEEVAVDLKRLRTVIGARGGLSFASPEALLEHLGVQPGSVSPLAAINDTAKAVAVVLDAGLLEAEVVNCHPLMNDRTTSLAPNDLLAFLRATGHEPMIIAPPPGTPPE